MALARQAACAQCGGPNPPTARTLCSPSCVKLAKNSRQARYDVGRGPHRGKFAVTAEQRARWQAAYRQKNPEKFVAQRDAASSRRRATKRQASVAESVTRAEVWASSNGTCHICGTAADPADWHQDHVWPLSEGGDHALSNLAVAHPACNMQKRASIWYGPRGWPPATTRSLRGTS